MIRTILSFVGGFYLLRSLAFQAAGQVLSKVSVNISKAILRWGLPNVHVDLYFLIQNDNAVGGSAEGFEGALYYAGVKISDISLLGRVDILPNSQNEVVVTSTISLLSLPTTIQDILSAGQVNLSVLVKGTLYTSYVNIPIDQSVPLISI